MLNLTPERLDALRSEYNNRNKLRTGHGKYPRQKMLPEYQFIYPWVLPDEQDPYFAFCKVCECRLSAKRSDLGKHEGSMKHTDNVAKKGIIPVASNINVTNGSSRSKSLYELQMQRELSESTAESDDEEFQKSSNDVYIKQEPDLLLIETDNRLTFEEPSGKTPAQSAGNRDVNDDEEESDDYDDEENDNEEYSPSAKRRTSETDSQSQHSSIITPIDYLQVQSVSDKSSGQCFSIKEIASPGPYRLSKPTITCPQQYTPLQNIQQAPCKITIKKIAAPLTPSTPVQVSSTARITPATDTINISQHTSKQVHSSSSCTTLVTPPLRDSFELFFDSICASVKALPPKLATEGKIRVMQLIGELELRAITEREQEERSQIQQNSAVASTTK